MLAHFRDALNVSSETILSKISDLAANLFGAALILIFGWFIAWGLAKLVDKVFRMIGIQLLAEKIHFEELVKKMNLKTDSVGIIAGFVKWMIMIVAFLGAAETLGLSKVSDFFNSVLSFVPVVAISVAILVIASVLAGFLAKVVKGSAEAGGLAYANLFGSVVSFAVWIFAIIAVLYEFGLDPVLVRYLFIAVVAMMALAGGLAFGLGGQEVGRKLLEKAEKGVLKSSGEAEEESAGEQEELEI